MRDERVTTTTTTNELRRRRANYEQLDGQGIPENVENVKELRALETWILPFRRESASFGWLENMCSYQTNPRKLSELNYQSNTLRPMYYQDLELRHLSRIDLSGYTKILPNSISEMISKLKLSKYFEHEPLLPPEVERNDMPFKYLEKSPPLPERRDAEHDSFTLRQLLPTPRYTEMGTMIETGCAPGNPAETTILVSPLLALPERRDAEHGSLTQCFLRTPRYTEAGTMIETGCASGNPAEPKRERMAILVTNIASIVLCALMVFASIESKSLSIIASILDPFFDLLWGFILWLTFHAMQNPNQHKYPMGMKRLQPVGIIVFGSFGLQLLFQAAKQFITKSEPEKDPQKEKWMIGVMTFVTMVQLMLAFYCRRFENKILRAYAEHHSSNVITNLISVAAAVLAIRYYWWIDPTGAIIILLYTMNTWKKTFIENLFVLLGRTAPPEILEKVKTLIFDHNDDIKEIGRLGAYTFVSDEYFVEVDIVLPKDIDRCQAHDIGERLQVELERLPEVARAFVHIDFEDTHRVEHRSMV